MKSTDYVAAKAKAGDRRRSLTRRRDAHFAKACEAVIERYRRLGREVSDRIVVEEVLRSKAPEYYISLDHCLDTIGRLLAARRPKSPVRSTLRRALWDELVERVKTEANRRRRASLTQCVARVLARGEASGYFISTEYALRIFHNRFKTLRVYECV